MRLLDGSSPALADATPRWPALFEVRSVKTHSVFSAGTSRWLTFADALGLIVAALAGLAVHELSTERVVHSLEVIGESGGSDGEHAESRRHAVEA